MIALKGEENMQEIIAQIGEFITSQEPSFFLIQGIGVVASVFVFIAFICKDHKNIMLYKTIDEFLFGIQYLCLGAYTGTAVNWIGCIRNLIFRKNVQKGKSNKPVIIVFSVLFSVIGILTWEGYQSVLVIFAKVLSTVAYGNRNTTILRLLVLFTAVSWLIYDSFAFSLAGIAADVLTAVSALIGLARYTLLPKLRKSGGAEE